MTPKITALAITLNEENNIERYIKSLDFVDEIIIVDSFSKDKTVEIAANLNVKVYQNTFNDFSSQRNFALSKASNDWILFFDLDEYITESLKNEILESISKPNNKVAFYIKRQFNFLGTKIKYGGWQNDKVARLFNKKHCSYEGLVHETLKINGDSGDIKNKLNHESYTTFDQYNNKLNLYSKLQSENLYLKKNKPNAYHFIFRPFYRFVWQYIYRLGFLDGKEGFILAYVHSFSVFKRYLQLWMKYRKLE